MRSEKIRKSWYIMNEMREVSAYLVVISSCVLSPIHLLECCMHSAKSGMQCYCHAKKQTVVGISTDGISACALAHRHLLWLQEVHSTSKTCKAD